MSFVRKDSSTLDKSLPSVGNELPVEDAGGFTRSRKNIKGKNKSAKSSRNRGGGKAPAPVSKGNASGSY